MLAVDGTVSADTGTRPEPVPLVSLNSGMVGINPDDEVEDPGRFGVEYRHTPMGRWQLTPALGYARAEADASYTYLDLKRDFHLTERWTLTPSLGAGYYNASPQIRLGHELEFRTALELTWRVSGNFRVGAAIDHLSNSSLSDRNPGIESFILTVLVPVP